MGKPSKELSNRITVMVFKDNYAARTFQVSLAWLNRFGLLLFALVLIAGAAGILAAKYYGISRTADLSRVHQLQVEVADLQAALKQYQDQPRAPETEVAVSAPEPAPTTDLAAGLPPFAPASPSLVGAPPRAYVFSALPPESKPMESAAPIMIGSPKAVWRGKMLDVTFNIQYQRADKGNQQGRIIILARGPDTLVAYPQGVLSAGGAESLIQPLRGEYFSVSRFRAVSAEFGPMRDSEQLKEIEILLVTDSGQLIIYDRLPVTGTASMHRSAPMASPSPREAS